MSTKRLQVVRAVERDLDPARGKGWMTAHHRCDQAAARKLAAMGDQRAAPACARPSLASATAPMVYCAYAQLRPAGPGHVAATAPPG